MKTCQKRDKYNPYNTNKQCHDCLCKEGELHDLGCDMERCPFCNGQLLSCNCCYEKLGFTVDDTQEFCGLPKEIYEKGLPDNLMVKWEEILNKKGRIPYICYPLICTYCGKLWPNFFKVPDSEWKYYIQPSQRRSIICKVCYAFIKNAIDKVHNNKNKDK